MPVNYLKIGKATELEGREYKIYRALEILPGFLSWSTLILLVLLSYFNPVFTAYFLIAFDVYWLLLVVFLGLHLWAAYKNLAQAKNTDWRKRCADLGKQEIRICARKSFCYSKTMDWEDLVHIVFFPVYNEKEIIRQSVESILNSDYPTKNIILVIAVEERGGPEVLAEAERVKNDLRSLFRGFFVYVHPDGLAGEIKGKGSNQAYAAKCFKKDFLDSSGLDQDKLLASVFDIDTVIGPQYFFVLSWLFLTADKPHRKSYQPVPVYNNNLWQAPFFARVAASSNSFWQMMQQIRSEKLATYSSHSMTWRALKEIGFWSTTMVSEDSRIFWHCYCYYRGEYEVVPMHYPVSMDVTMDESFWQTAKNLYKQQQRWGWGVENIPYLLFNTAKLWKQIPKGKFINRILVQLYGFHSWATNALIIGLIGWMPLLLGGDRFNATVLSTNLPFVTRTLMTLAMSGLVFSAIISTLLLPRRPAGVGPAKNLIMLLQWLVLPFSIIIFGAIPGLHAQSKLMLGRYLGFFVTPKKR